VSNQTSFQMIQQKGSQNAIYVPFLHANNREAYNMEAILLHYNITDLLSDWQLNIIDGPTKLVRQDAILGGLSIGQIGVQVATVLWRK